MIDSFGRSISFAYDGNGLLTQATTPDQLTINYTYTNASPMASNPALSGITFLSLPVGFFALASVSYPNATFVSYQYGNSAYPFALTGKTDERGIQISTWNWTTDGRVAQNSQAGGVETYSLVYDFNNGQTTVTNPDNMQTIYNFNANVANTPLLTQIQGIASANCAASNSIYAYDSNTYLNQVTDGEGRVTSYVREARGLPTAITRGAGTASAATTMVTWHSTWHVPTEVVEPGRTTDYVWSSAGQLTSITQTDTTSQSVPYSTNGQTRTWTVAYTGLHVSSVDGPLPGTGDTVSYTYDTNGYLNTITNELGQVTTITATNLRGQPTSITDPNGIITALTYNKRGWLKSVSVDTANTPATTKIGYDAAGDITTITEPNGAFLSFTYDGARRLATVTDAAGETITFVRDVMGNATSVAVKNAAGAVAYSKTQVFDELGRIIQSLGAVPANSTYTFGYDRYLRL
ncbi:MAG: hypothetical protein ACREO5_01540 [Candidatus Binatia bacterium]